MFADYLSIRKIIDEGAIEQHSEIKEKLQKVINNLKGVSNEKELLTKFIHNKTEFRKLTTLIDGQSIASILDNICDQILDDFGYFRKSYENDLINNIAHSTTISNGNILLNKNILHGLISDIIKFDSDKAFRQFFNMPLEEIKQALDEGDIKKYKISNQKTLENLKSIFNNNFGKEGWETLTNYLLNFDKSFRVSYVNNNNADIVLSNFTNFKSYGIYMPDFKGLEIPLYYHGQYITKRYVGNDKVEFYVTSNYPLETSKVTYFPSERLAKQAIDEKKRIVSNTSRINLHYSELDNNGNFIKEDSYRKKIKGIGKISKGAILTILDYNVKTPAHINTEDSYYIYGQGQMQEFENYLYKLEDEQNHFLFSSDERESILNILNTPEKIAIFVSEIANIRDTAGKINRINKNNLLNDILPKLNDDNNLQYKYYYVYDVKGENVTLIPFDNVTTLIEYQQKDKNIPVSRMWNAVSEVLSPLLGTQLNVLTASQIQEQFQNYSDKKAFIKNGQIYVNISNASTSDLLHEYAHIALAYLKQNSEYRESYKGLLQSIWNISTQREKNSIIDSYEYYSQEDIMEELFVSKFGKWVEDNDVALDSIFRNNEGLNKAKEIFDVSDKSIKEVFGTSLKSVFTNFNNGVSALLSENPSLMDEQFQEQFTLQRRQSDWIRKRKENNELEEVCK